MKPLARASFAAAGVAVAGGAVSLLLWCPAPPPAAKTIEHPISLEVAAPNHENAKLAARDLARVAELERRRDAEALVEIALGERAPAASSEQENRLRVTALHALANVGSPRAARVLRDVVLDERRVLVLRLAAAAALARTGKPEELAFLRGRLREEPSKILREKIRLSLETRRS